MFILERKAAGLIKRVGSWWKSHSGLLTRAFAVGWTPTVLSAPVKGMGAVPALWGSISNYFGDTEYGMYGPRAHVGCTTWEGTSKA